MIINNEILNAVIHCKNKAYLTKISQSSNKTEFDIVVEILKEKQKSTIETKQVAFKNAEIDLILDGIYKDEKNYSVPILISPFEKVQKTDKLFLSLQVYYLKQHFNLKVGKAEIIFGTQPKKTKIALNKFEKETKKLVAIIEQIAKTEIAPVNYKNSHCQLCEFHQFCNEKLKERDDLSLLGKLKPKEIEQRNNRGIFSVKQLSYTFRPKKNPYRRRKYLPELKAFAIREQKVFIQKLPELEQKETEIFFDIEGIPDRDFYYLIGVIVKSGNSEMEYSFWADEISQQQGIFIQFVELTDNQNDFVLYHYGSYEIQALNRISKKLPKFYQDKIKHIIEKSFNILTLISNDIYVPTYTNGLKDIANYLGFSWSSEKASGLQSIVWRYNWEISPTAELKNNLIVYNLEDCKALIIVLDWIINIPKEENEIYKKTDSIKRQSPYKFGNNDFQIKELEDVNKFAYFNYQRDKVYIKTNPYLVKNKKRAENYNKEQKQLKPNKTVFLPPPKNCLICSGTTTLYDKLQRTNIDLKINNYGIKRIITDYRSKRYECKNCNKTLCPQEFMAISKYGYNLLCWIINQFVHYRISGQQIAEILQEYFGIIMNSAFIHNIKKKFAKQYETTFFNLLDSLRKGKLLHCDETTFKVGQEKYYVWVFTNMNTVCYILRPTREAEFLKELFVDFKGVLISDFYAGYDALDCPKQRCLIHLIRDINDDLLKNQQNEEFGKLCKSFSELLNCIILTANRYGLKNRHLNKHKKQVNLFLKNISLQDFETEIAERWKKKFLSYKTELFTFLDYDNIPWNNNNGEHAIKAVAFYRRNVSNTTEKALQEYLVLLSIHETCKFRGINFFDFLKSNEINVSEYEERFLRKNISMF